MAAPDHASREHDQWSASASERNFACAGALALTDGLPEQESEAAAWGTAAHTIAERVLRGEGPADKFVGTTVKTKSHEIEVDDEMVDVVEAYTGYVVGQIDSDDTASLKVEQKFSLAGIKPPFEAGGTADAVIYYPSQKLLEVVDLKGGRGVVVAVKGNPQLRTYALGAVLANPGLDVTHVRSTIVQPRAPHKDGRIRSETYHIADLVEWTADLLVAMKQSKEALVDLSFHTALERENMGLLSAWAKDRPGGLAPAEWRAKYLKPGNHCDKTFCKARGFCPALEKAAVDAAGIWFDNLDQPRLSNDPDPDDPTKLARDLDMLELIEGWCKSRREHAHRLAEAGTVIPDYILVPKQGREKWNEGADAKVIAAAKTAGLSPDKYVNPGKLRTPKQVRKELGNKADLVSGLSSTPDAGTNLVRHDRTTRQAIPSAGHLHFSQIED